MGAVGTAALLEQDGEALAMRLGFREVLLEVEEGELEPALMIEPVLRLGRLDARQHGANRRWQRGIGGPSAGGAGEQDCQSHKQGVPGCRQGFGPHSRSVEHSVGWRNWYGVRPLASSDAFPY